jgi:DNA-binding winged helix-turn-helix (wHTH) protein
METGKDIPAGFEFSRFRVLPGQRQLLVDGISVELGGRTFDVLMALIEAPGVVIAKHGLIKRVWSDRIVDECNLRAQIAAVRKAFGADGDLIRTVPGRSYQFTAAVRTIPAKQVSPGEGSAKAASPRWPTNLPDPVSELIGRSEELSQIQSLAATHRPVTVIGAAGIGKTRLAIDVARRLLPKRVDGVWHVELAALSDSGLVPAAVAAAVGLALATDKISAITTTITTVY